MALRTYANRIRFQRNAWLYLAHTLVIGVAFGVFRLLFNFYIVSLGYDETLLGSLVMLGSLAALVAALPAGYVADRLGRKTSLMLSSAVISATVLGMVFWHDIAGLYLLNIAQGLGQSLAGVTLGPFLMENSRQEERTYLFSFNFGVQTVAASIGNWVGGHLPGWLSAPLGVGAKDTSAYAWAITVVGAGSFLALLPLAFLQKQRTARQRGEAVLSPFQFAARHPKLLSRLLSPQLIIGLGAGLLIPFLNLFFRRHYARLDSEVGTLFAWGSLAMGLGFLLAPPLAERWGMIQVIVSTQALSIPFLVLLGFSPWYGLSALSFLARTALMNMSNPVYQTFVMEAVEPESRATMASLSNMSFNFGWTFSPLLSGWLQEKVGFHPIFGLTIGSYLIGIYLMWRFFWPRKAAGIGAPGGAR